MPIFEYKCASCGADFEKLVFSAAIVCCPACNSVDVVKKFSVFGMSGVEKQTSSGCSSCNSGSCSTCGH